MNLLLLLASALAAEPAPATTEPALRMEVDDDAALDVPAIAQALTSELDVAVILEGDAPARVSVRAQGPGTIAIVYEGDDGARRERVVELPPESAESTRIVVLLVSNLARDQVGALGLAPVVEEAAPAETPAPVRTWRDPQDRPFHFGVAVTGGAAALDELAPFVAFGLETGWRVTPHFAFGVTGISVSGGGSTSGGKPVVQVNGTPYAELSGWVGSRVEPFGRAGVMIRGNNADDGGFGAAPTLGGGARFYANRMIALGLEADARLVVTEGFQINEARLPLGSVLGTVGFSTTFHF